ncbi:hypothetical protein [Sphingobacterium nematocida]|uniref:hypothetical protein n=1 Tax=Sphingobacterium nematocida TaxID=1513896 RepID=UPI001115C3BB|nr:hypothetical protein [Sphingobacterium nematocida]
MSNFDIIKSSSFAFMLRIVGIFMVFILTSCPIKASIKQNSTQQASSGLGIKQSKLITSSEVRCVLDGKESVAKVTNSAIELSPSIVLITFFCFLFLSVSKNRVRIRLPQVPNSGTNNLFIFFNRFNL